MNNQIAIILAVLIIGIFVLDHFWLEQGLLLKTGKAFDDAIDYIIFWR